MSKFMGKGWDGSGIAYNSEVWENAYRVLKPGGHLFAFGGTRTWHRLAVAIEDAGFDIRDSICWLYASGFPKSHDVSKAIDKNNGEVGRKFRFTRWMCTTGVTAKQINEATNTQMGNHYLTHPTQPAIPTPELWQVIRPLCGDVPAWVDELVQRIAAEREVVGKYETDMGGLGGERLGTAGGDITAPATPAAQQWQGWGTALKPAFEPIVVARKPLIGTVAENVLAHGTGALNIDGCRIGFASAADEAESKTKNRHADFGTDSGGNAVYGDYSMIARSNYNPPGRWPANVILDESQAAELDKQSGVGVSRKGGERHSANAMWGRPNHSISGDQDYDDQGGASRFFYCPKANSSERPRDGDTAHPTVKPLELMQYLIKLVTPPGGTVLEPFAGSGTTLEACIIEGFKCIGIELTPEYLPLIVQRVTKPIEVTLL
jgi:site-specific DNA-methyltransferase (adenine-specific)